MKRNMIALTLLLMVTLSGCSNGISQSDYEQIISEMESISEEYDNLQNEYNQVLSEKELVQEQYDTLQENYEKLDADYTDILNEKAENIASDLQNQFVQAWIDTSFSGNGSCSSRGDTLFVSVLTGKEISQENVKAMWDELVSAMGVYIGLSKETPALFPYRYVSISLYDSSKVGILQFDTDTEENTISMSFNGNYGNRIAQWCQ